MGFIVQTVSGDQRLQLAIEEIVRPMSIGTNWNKIRIGIRASLWGIGTTSASCGLLMGVCQGSQGLFSTSTTDYFGAQLGGTSVLNDTTLNFATLTGVGYYLSAQQGINFVKKVGTTITITHPSNLAGGIVAAPLTNHSQLFFDITKTSSTQYTISYWAPISAAAATTDITQAVFLQNLENEAAPSSVSNLPNASLVSYTGSGLFDNVSLSWNRGSPTLEVSDWAICRFI